VAEIAPIHGLIELTDNFTSELGLARAALSNFTKENQQSLTAVAVVTGTVAAGIAAIGVAAIELGKRGSDVNDLRATIEQFAGGANEAKAAMDALRAGTLNTVDDFTLASNAAHLLSTGVKLTAADFGTLGEAAFVLQNRGLGGTAEQLKLVSDALVTGRTRALAMSLGVIAVDDAEEAYAKTLGVTAEQLSESGKAEAKRIEVLRILREATVAAGEQQRDFGEEFEFASAQVRNFIDDLGSSIASSDVFSAGLRAVGEAVAGAFDNNKAKAIENITSLLEDGAVKLIDLGQVAITAARIFEGSFGGVRTVIAFVSTGIVGVARLLAETIAVAAGAAAKLHLISPETLSEIQSSREELRGMRADLALQTEEAAASVLGHTKFGEALDVLSQNMNDVRTAMMAAKNATGEQTEASGASAEAAAANAAAQADLTSKMIDQTKVAAAMTKSSKELSTIWDDYFKAVARSSGTSRDQQIADIEATFNSQVASLDHLDPLFNEKYKALRATANANLTAISVDWDSVRDRSIEALQETADKAHETYEAMIDSGLHFTREVLDEQLKKWKDAQAAANGWGTDAKKAVADVTKEVKILDSAWADNAAAAAASINGTTIMVRTLHGDLISLQEAMKLKQTGGSFDVTSANFGQALTDYLTKGGFTSGSENRQFRDPMGLAKKGYSFSEVIKYAFDPKQQGTLPPPQGPRIPGFIQGGTVDIKVGEGGPETVRVPLGSTVYPTGTGPSGGTQVVNLNFQVNGTAVQTAEAIKKIIMSQLKSVRQFGSA